MRSPTPGRRRILTLVRSEERTAGEIAAELPVTWPAVSQHLRVLKGAGLITERREGTRRHYRARPQGLADVRAFLDEFWDASSGAETGGRTWVS